MKNVDMDKPMDYFEKYYQTRPDWNIFITIWLNIILK